MVGRLSLWLLVCPSAPHEPDPPRSRDMLRFKDRLGLRTALLNVFDLRGISVFPLAA